MSSAPRFSRWLLPSLVLLLALGAFLARKSLRPSSPSTEPRPLSVAEPGRAPGARPGRPSDATAPAAASAPGRRLSPHDRFLKEKDRVRAEALEEVRDLLARQGGAAALEHIARAARSAPSTPPEILKGAYLTRLIPWVASEDPRCASSALALVQELVRRGESDPWVRFQSLAGLAGVLSARMSALSTSEDGPVRSYGFIASDDPDFARTEFEFGLADRAPDALAAALPLALQGDASEEVRSLSAMILRLHPVPDAGPLLLRALQSDDDATVRQEAVRSLARLRPPGSAEALRQAITADPAPEVRETSVRELAAADPDGAETAALLGRAAVSPDYSVLRPAVVESLFDGLAGSRAADYQRSLVSFLLQPAREGRALAAFLDRAVEAGCSEFLPLLRGISAEGLDEPGRRALAEGIRRLEQAPHYAALSRQIQEAGVESGRLWARIRAPGLGASEREVLEQQATALLRRIWTLRQELRR